MCSSKNASRRPTSALTFSLCSKFISPAPARSGYQVRREVVEPCVPHRARCVQGAPARVEPALALLLRLARRVTAGAACRYCHKWPPAGRPGAKGPERGRMAPRSALQAGTPPEPDPLDWKGTERFEVIRRIGRGGMGVVYEARDREEHRRVALKTLVHFDPASLYLFKQEFRTLAGVTHPNLVRLYELVAVADQRVFFAMELVRGVDFAAHVAKVLPVRKADERSVTTGLDAPEALRSGTRRASVPPPPVPTLASTPADLDRLRPALRQLVEGVQALHTAGKLHRDIKPSNVLVTHEGRVVILDFGVATELRQAKDVAL